MSAFDIIVFLNIKSKAQVNQTGANKMDYTLCCSLNTFGRIYYPTVFKTDTIILVNDKV